MALGNAMGSHFLALGRLAPVQVAILSAILATSYSQSPHHVYSRVLVDHAPLIGNARLPTSAVLGVLNSGRVIGKSPTPVAKIVKHQATRFWFDNPFLVVAN